MKQLTITSKLTGCILYLFCSLACCDQAEPPPRTVRIEVNGEIELIASKWIEPYDAVKVQQCVKAVSDWHKAELFDAYRVKVFPEHELVKKIKREPAVLIRPKGLPDVIFWIPIADKGKKILIETPSTGAMKLVAPPKGQTIDLEFIKQS